MTEIQLDADQQGSRDGYQRWLIWVMIFGLLVGFGWAVYLTWADGVASKPYRTLEGPPDRKIETLQEYQQRQTDPGTVLAAEVREYCLARGYRYKTLIERGAWDDCLLEYWQHEERYAALDIPEEIDQNDPAEIEAWILADPSRTSDPSVIVNYRD